MFASWTACNRFKIRHALCNEKRCNASLTEPIDDPDAHDPSTVNEAKLSIYWTEWLAAMYKELESLT